MPTLTKLLLACALLMLANADDADMKRRIKLKTTRQLNEMLSEAGVEAPAGADKETLRDLVFENDALTKYEEKHPPTPRPGGRRGAGGGGAPASSDLPPSGMASSRRRRRQTRSPIADGWRGIRTR